MTTKLDGVGLIYVATFEDIAITAAQDLFEIVAPSNSRVVIREFEIGQESDEGDAQAEMLGLKIIRGYTSAGSGGAAVTPYPVAPWSGAATAGSTVKRNNTTIASGGTPKLMRATAWNVMGGYRYYPGFRGERIMLDAGERCVFRLPNAPIDSLTCHATLVFEELGVIGM